ncbi:MAG TPA: M48 family metalloprotease [Pyrinomonadaceae bacterium]
MRAGKVTGWVLLALLTLQAACGGALSGGGAQASLPHASAGFNLFSPEQDIQLGEASAEEIMRQVVVLRDERTGRYVQRLGERVASAAPGYKFPYKFVVVASPEVNAFALPGGYVFVNEGAVEAAHTEGELAGVLAHEIAHVSLRHGTTQASRAYLARTAMSIINAVAGAGEGDFWHAAAAACGAGANRFFLRSNRAAELQADAEGARLLAEAGFDPRDMANFFERLDEREGERADAAGDHPDPASRVEAIGKVVAELGQSPAPGRDSEDFRRIKSRLSNSR